MQNDLKKRIGEVNDYISQLQKLIGEFEEDLCKKKEEEKKFQKILTTEDKGNIFIAIHSFISGMFGERKN